MQPNHQHRSFRPAEENPRPITLLHGVRVWIPGALDAVRGEDGVWVVPLEEIHDA